MHVDLHPKFSDTAEGLRARELTSACVHCGFCLATCPTYLDNRDERDSPRGRIYLIKQLLESGEASAITHTHLDSCLSCRSCETTCPSGMRYGQLLDIGRGLMEQQAPRSPAQRISRRLLRQVLTRTRLFAMILWAGRLLRPLMPSYLARKIPGRQALKPIEPTLKTSGRRVLLLEGCVQRAATPRTNNAVRRVLAQLGIELLQAPGAGCCGAVNYHLAAHQDGLDDLRRNIDAWWPHIDDSVEAIISSASGCGAMLVDYGHLLADDPAYAEKARVIASLARDIGQVIVAEDLACLQYNTDVGPVAVQTPCSLQHGLGEPELVSEILRRCGFVLADTRDKHLCCGSAGTYSLLQRQASERLRDNKLRALCEESPGLIATANVGCQLHLDETSKIPVVHWIELLDNA
jgi:glycolate oxidase iron-sulfur subunit